MKKAVVCAVVVGIGLAAWFALRPLPAPPLVEAAVPSEEPVEPEGEAVALPDPRIESVSARPPSAEPGAEPGSKSSLVEDLRLCLAESSVETRRRRFLELLAAMQPGDTRDFMNVLQEFENRGIDLTFERRAFWRRRGEIDPEQALADWEPLFKSTVTSADSLAQLFRGWGGANPDAARAWLRAHRQHVAFVHALHGYVDAAAAKDPAGTAEFLFSSLKADDPILVSAMKRSCAEIMQQGSASQAAAWFERLPTDGAGVVVRQSLVRDITSGLVDEDLAVATAWVGEQSSQPWRDWPSINVVADRYATQDPMAAMDWITTLPPDPGNGTITGVGAVVRHWYDQDPAALEQWIHSIRPSGSRLFAQAAGDYAFMLAPVDYSKAVEWLNQIPAAYPAPRRYFEGLIAPYAPRPPSR